MKGMPVKRMGPIKYMVIQQRVNDFEHCTVIYRKGGGNEKCCITKSMYQHLVFSMAWCEEHVYRKIMVLSLSHNVLFIAIST